MTLTVNSHETHPTYVLAVNPGLPIGVLDRILTGVEQGLTEEAATRVWAERAEWGIAVMADLPVGEHRR